MASRKLLKRTMQSVWRIPDGCSIPFGIKWRLLQCIGVNSHVPWPTHFTSTIHGAHKIHLGKETYPGDSPGCYIQGRNHIYIGDFTNLAPGVGIISANHDPYDNSRWIKGKPIRIGKHCWVGMNAVILPEVELGDYTIVGAGSVVTKSFTEGYCVIAGNPARVVRELDVKKINDPQPN